jgi:TATA-box binding protein (TBP) (component of TFIID and TFIIIB)
MSNSIYNQLNGEASAPSNNLIERLAEFRRTFSGDPQAIVQNLVNSGKVSQDQLNAYAKQANEIYKIFK